uniref:Uncharacterized protein n=1 Tax=Anguilla anguilla TaxID=7936 RepID=A0A0E9X7V4_ANGAN
MQPTCQRGFA